MEIEKVCVYGGGGGWLTFSGEGIKIGGGGDSTGFTPTPFSSMENPVFTQTLMRCIGYFIRTIL